MEFLFFVGIFVFCFICYLLKPAKTSNTNTKPLDDLVKKIDNNREKEEQENLEIEKIINFAKVYGVDLNFDFSSLNSRYKSAQRMYSGKHLTVPTEPTYTKGVVSGSIADNISVIANEQKKRDYEEKLEKNKELGIMGDKAFDDFISIKNSLYDKISKLPNNEEYLNIFNRIYNGRESVLRNLR